MSDISMSEYKSYHYKKQKFDLNGNKKPIRHKSIQKFRTLNTKKQKEPTVSIIGVNNDKKREI